MTSGVLCADADIKWMGAVYPNLHYREVDQCVVGELDLRACYDATSRKLRSEGSGRDERIRNAPNYIEDVFEIEIRLDMDSIGPEGWPNVYEVGGRVHSIVRRHNVPKIDLHVYPDDSFCLGMSCARSRRLSLRRIIEDLVAPFLYRLAYVDRFGLEAARRDLWGEYAHGDAGRSEYSQELADYARRAAGRNDPCPCGSGRKTKKCCLDEIQAWKNATRGSSFGSGPTPGG